MVRFASSVCVRDPFRLRELLPSHLSLSLLATLRGFCRASSTRCVVTGQSTDICSSCCASRQWLTTNTQRFRFCRSETISIRSEIKLDRSSRLCPKLASKISAEMSFTSSVEDIRNLKKQKWVTYHVWSLFEYLTLDLDSCSDRSRRLSSSKVSGFRIRRHGRAFS